MASDREIKLRIRSVRGIGQLTNAMKMVASSQIRKVETKAKAGRPYTAKLRSVMQELTGQVGDDSHPLLVSRPVEKVGVICLGSDKGLCGSYNANLIKLTNDVFAALPGGKPAKLIVLGSKIQRQLKRRGLKADHYYQDWQPDFSLAQKLADICADWYLKGEVDEVICCYTEAISMLSNVACSSRILPLTQPNKEEGLKVGEVTKASKNAPEASPEVNQGRSFIFEPSAEEALEYIVPSYLRVMMLQMLLESKTSELGSRLKAMTNATENAEKLAQELTLEYYRIRQNNITTEIIEISSGAEALNS